MSDETIVPSPAPLHVVAAGRSAMGRRGDNEDVVVLHDDALTAQTEQFGRLYLLADGRGRGEAAGALASRIASETIPVMYYQRSDAQYPLGRLQQALYAAHTRIRAAVHEHAQVGMMTTCTAIVVKGNRVWVAHIGDSRAYLIREGAISRMTTDHSLIAAHLRAGTLSPWQAQQVQATHDVLLHALGGEERLVSLPDFAIYTVRSGDVLLLCSDGLWSALSEQTIVQTVLLHPPEQACEQLLQQASALGKAEDISVIVLSFQEKS